MRTRWHGRGGPTRLGPTEVVDSFDGPCGAYVHVPFCESICPFCPYNKVLADRDVARRYFGALHREVDAYVAARASANLGPFTSLYVGGGTPTLYPDELGELVARVPVSGERATEVLPTHGTIAGLDALARSGITAVSIGAQSFHDEVLRRLRRPHDAGASLAAVRNAIGRFACVDVDLIVDVEWEERDVLSGAFLRDLQTCFVLGVDQVSTYPLMRFGYTPFGAARHNRRREHAVLAEATALAASMGYERRSVWTFNRLGSPAYTSITRRRFLGMGAGGSSFAGRDFYVNHFGIAAYVEALDRGGLPVARWLRLGRWGGAAYDAFWQAYAGRVDPRALAEAYGPLVAAAVRAAIAPMIVAGRLRPEPGGYRLTPRGMDAYHDLERSVTYRLIEPLWAEMLAEHASDDRAGWVRAGCARSGWTWALVRRLFELRLPDGGP